MNCIYWFEIIEQSIDFGMRKFNFVGGEPTLCPFLAELISYSKNFQLTTGFVSNGTRIMKPFLDQCESFIDWIGLSLDSGDEKIQQLLGRGSGTHVRYIRGKSKIIKKAGIKLKINSVITRLNYKESLAQIIKEIHPDRWKVFQVLSIKGLNDKKAKELLISKEEFESFIERHARLKPIAEDNQAMLDSYIMVDPMGRFYQNTNSMITRSRPIQEAGVFEAFNDIHFDHSKFMNRGGLYAW